MSRALGIAVPVVAGVTALLLATDVWPGLRGPENWRWERRVFLSPWLLASVVVFAATVLAAARVRSAWSRDPFGRRLASLAVVVALIFAQMVLLTAAEPGGLSNIPRRVESPSFTSYDTVARGVDDLGDFLARYHETQRRFPVHGPSQPPGRVLYFWTVRRCLGDESGPAASGYLLLLLGALSVVPLVALVGGRSSPDAVGASVLLMAALPGYLLFTPQTDHLILFLSLTSAALLVEAMRYASHRAAPFLALGAGLTAGLGVLVSFTTLAALGAWGLAFLGMVVLAKRRRVPFPTTARVGGLVLAALAGLGAVIGTLAWLGLNWPAVFRECVAAAHRVQVLVHGREYSTWVVWNVADFVLFLGPPLAVVWLARLSGEWRDAKAEIPFATALVVALAVLDGSGKILGETGRIWMFLMPLAVGAAASARSVTVWPLAAAQFLVLIVMRACLNVPG